MRAVEPRWFRIFIYITGGRRLVNLRRLALSFREATAGVAARYAAWRRFRGFIRCACFAKPELKRQSRQTLGVAVDAIVILTVGSSFKYLPIDGLDFGSCSAGGWF